MPHGWKKSFLRNWDILGNNFRREWSQAGALQKGTDGTKDEEKLKINESQFSVLDV
jgi:hypothetical protein